MNAIFIFGAAAVCASATLAGIIASSKGNATTAPTPRNTVRRDKCFFVMNITGKSSGASVRYRHLRHFHIRLARTLGRGHLLHLECGACDNAEQDGREAIVIGIRPA